MTPEEFLQTKGIDWEMCYPPDKKRQIIIWMREYAALFRKSVPYQSCPACKGSGRILAPGFTSAIYLSCPVCEGKRIIPQHVLPDKPNPNTLEGEHPARLTSPRKQPSTLPDAGNKSPAHNRYFAGS